MTPRLEEEVQRTLALLPEADAEFKEAEARNQAVHAEYGSALQMRTANHEALREATFELQRLKRVGPQVEVAVPQSPNTI